MGSRAETVIVSRLDSQAWQELRAASTIAAITNSLGNNYADWKSPLKNSAVRCGSQPTPEIETSNEDSGVSKTWR